MSFKIRALKNVASSWAGLAVNVAVGFFLSPFILHHLGDDAYGLWILMFSLTGHYGLFDFGIRSSLIRYVSEFRATRDSDQLTRLINTSLFSYTCVGLALMIPTLIASFYLNHIFHIPAGLEHDAQALFLILGIALALNFPLGVSSGILEGLQSFHVLNWTNIASTLLRAVLIVAALRHGLGLITVTLITVILPLVAAVVRWGIVQRMLHTGYGWRYVDRDSFRRVARYGSVTFMIIVASRLRFKTDAIIIGGFLSAAAITFFSIAGRLVDYSTEVVNSLAQIFTPMSSEFHATGDRAALRRVFIVGNRACALTMFPICTALVILGKSVITAWVGARYVSSYNVLLILLIPSTLFYAQATSTRILFGMSRHRVLAYVALIEGVANIVLSVALVRPYGIVGDAIGTAIPLLGTSLFFLPGHLCHQLEVPLGRFLREAYLWPALLCIPMALVLVLMQRLLYAQNYLQLLLHVVVGGAVYSAGALWLLMREPMGMQLRARIQEFLH
jgi:O-antigen/teichoic acid export membrane protein